ATNVSSSRTIDPAMAGSSPVKPNKIIALGIAVFVGFGLPFGVVFVRYQVSQKLLVRKDVANKTAIPILGEVSHFQMKKPYIINQQDRSPIAEQFRLIRTNLQFSLGSMDKKVILVTSSLSGEGKTFFSLNLGISLSLLDKRVAICEFDLRKPALLKYLHLSSKKGISDYLMNEKISLSEIAIHEHKLHENLTLFGCGRIPDNPAELMLTDRVPLLISQLKEEFDIVIIDSAPVGQVADAFSLSQHADITTYIMRFGDTPAELIDFMDDSHQDNKLINPAIVLNDGKLQGSYG